MHRAGRGGGEVVEDEVAVGGAVDRVVADVLEAEVVGDRVAVDLPVDAGQGAGAERHHAGAVERELEAQHVAGEHPEVGEQVVAEVDRLGALQVGVAGHRPVAVGARPAPAAAPSPPPPSSIARSECAWTTIATSVATWSLRERPVWSLPASGPISSPSRRSIAMWMSSSASSNSKPCSPMRVAHPLQAGVDLRQLLLVEDADLAQAAGVGLRLVDVVGRQPPVELDRAVERPEARVWVFAEAGHQRHAIAARASHTRATWASLIAGKKGSASERAEAASATGNWPSR